MTDPSAPPASAPSASRPAAAQPQSPDLHAALCAADALRQQRHWDDAMAAYAAILEVHPRHAVATHNLAVCHMGLQQYSQALQAAQQAQALNSQLWQSALLAAKAQHLLGHGELALQTLHQLRQHHPEQAQIDLEIAKRTLHTACDPQASAQAVEHLRQHPEFGAQARQMQLLSQLYDRPAHVSSAQLSQALVQHAQTYLQPRLSVPPPVRAAAAAGGRRRIGIIGNQLHASPVYYLTIGSLRYVAGQADLVVFNRSARYDWATAQFECLAKEWHLVDQHSAQALADTLRRHPVHALIDLSGWMDPTALQALATQPAERQYKWVGGQSATTGLGCFSGFITDQHHTPAGSQAHYTEPLLRLADGYVSYTPPPYMPRPQGAQESAKGAVQIGLIANPAKLSAGYLAYLRQHWPDWQARSHAPLQLHLVERRYRLEPLKQRISQQLAGVPLQFHTPASHADYLATIGQLHCVLDTWPYSGGLTTLEAQALGVPVYTRSTGVLFSERHSHAHNQYLGRELGFHLPTLDAPDFTPAHALQLDRHALQLAAKQRQRHQLLAEQLMEAMK